jgi:pimeloyl-ACP methyl ester carboxylesterase
MRYEAAEQTEHLREVAELAGLALPDVVLPDERHVVLNGMRLHYLDWGTSGRRPILFLHGGALNAHTWDLICLALRADYHCLALDLRGHGNSEWSPVSDYRLDAYRADIEALVGELGLDQLVLVGMSLGGMVSMAYAGRNADKLAALVLVDVGPETRDAGRQRIADFVAGPAEHDSIEDFVERAVAFNPLRRRELLRRSLQHNLRRTPHGTWIWKYDRRLYSPMMTEERQRRRAELWPEILKISCATLVVRGSESEVFLDEDAEKVAAILPRGSWVKIEGAGHTVQGDQPKALVEAIRHFLEHEQIDPIPAQHARRAAG